MATFGFMDLDKAERRRLVVREAVGIAAVWALLFGAYFLVPFDDASGASVLIRLVGAVTVFLAVCYGQFRKILSARLPGLRAIHALAVLVPLFLVLYSIIYLSLSNLSTSHFSEPLDHIDALYFTITVFATVGFGDITAVGALARALVSVQMMLNLVILGGLVRLVTQVVGVSRRRGAPASGSPDGTPDG